MTKAEALAAAIAALATYEDARPRETVLLDLLRAMVAVLEAE